MATVPCHCRFFFPPISSSSSSPSGDIEVITRRWSPVHPLAFSPVASAYTSSPNEWKREKENKTHNGKLISSVSNPLVKHCVKLRLCSSYRRSNGSVLIVGLTPILEICTFHRDETEPSSIIDQLIVLDGISIPDELNRICSTVIYVSANVLKKISGMQSIDSTEVIAIMRMPRSFCDLEMNGSEAMFHSLLPSPYRLLVLDGIQDPGNLGTLIRSARAFKWDGVFLLPGCCDPFNEKALRAARGASFQVPIVSGNWSQLNMFASKQRMKILAGHPANNVNRPNRTSFLTGEVVNRLASEALCLVLGSEGNGLSFEALERAELISIPMEGLFESLNVSVAGGIFLFMLQPQNQRD
ncbi:tRNA/rRNA methyltransferase (SpoU) family protein [Rhynchospora pubera]|uniref:tRNA/rRNA methyltransferase (SpoU) family protein n=1 Tax=Rhynchospora pubera TaxID=906938 RepID=A0AAV8EVJ1_9POAL|nr:tRNA/rRNA methyltransferase (SpoU) family protein [Rhynchospora pubera]